MEKKQKNNRGFAAILTLLIVIGLVSIITYSVSTIIYVKKQIGRSLVDSAQSYYSSESGIEDSLLRVIKNYDYTAVNNFSLDNSAISQNITQASGVTTIESASLYSGNRRKVRSEIKITATNVSFHYGVQVGEGGVLMEQNSGIIGNIYSNGNIVGYSGSRATGDVWIAGASNPSLDANWTVQNDDFAFGHTEGSAITAVDSADDMGADASLALGSDGFARISYYDATNKNLKFARCTNDSCTAKNIAVIASAGDVGKYTSIKLGSDGFARISYYDVTNGDLKFARCTDDDCSAPVISTVDSTGDIGQFSSLALDTANNFGMISYYSVTNGDLKFAQCTNLDCSARNISVVDSAGDVGKYTSIKLGSNGFARISYYDAANSNKNLKFVRCTNIDCSASAITTVDSADDVGQFSALALNSNNFGFISYYNNTSNSLKFSRCTNEDCTSKIITVADSNGNVGKYSSIDLGSDTFARISYYDLSNGAVKFMRCLDNDCASKNISSVDTQNDTGYYTSLALGSDGLGRISYRDNTSGDLKFIKCMDADCTPSQARTDAAQSFKLVSSSAIPLRRVSLYLRKIGSPSDVTVRVVPTESGLPDKDVPDVIATGTLSASMVTGNYGWVDVSFTTNPALQTNQTYWILIDTAIDNNNYWEWGMDNTDAYADGSGKFSADWTGGNWADAGGDLDFKVWVGEANNSINGVIVEGNVNTHSVVNSKICGDAYYQTIDAASLNFLNSPSGPACPDPLTNGTAYPGSADPPLLTLPISDGSITEWTADAVAGGTISGDYVITDNTSLGPKEITGNLEMTSNNKVLTVTGTIYVHGNINISNGSAVKCISSYGTSSCVVLADGWIHVENNGIFSGSGASGSFLMMLSTLQCVGTSATSPDGKTCGDENGAIDVHNQATGVVFYASRGMINLHNGVDVTEATGYKLRLDNTATITYDQGLVNASFTSGPGGGWNLQSWNEIQ